MGSSISGLNMPEFPISTHRFSPSCHEKISSEGCRRRRQLGGRGREQEDGPRCRGCRRA
jgi:hypothetical protein